MFEWMESVDVAGVLQEARDGDLRPGSRSQVKVKYFIIVYSSTSIRFPHLCQEYHDSFVTANDRGMRALGMVHLRAWVGKEGGIIFFSISVLFLSCC